MSKPVLLLRVFGTSRCVLGTRPARNSGRDVVATLRGAGFLFQGQAVQHGCAIYVWDNPLLPFRVWQETLRDLANVEALDGATKKKKAAGGRWFKGTGELRARG